MKNEKVIPNNYIIRLFAQNLMKRIRKEDTEIK